MMASTTEASSTLARRQAREISGSVQEGPLTRFDIGREHRESTSSAHRPTTMLRHGGEELDGGGKRRGQHRGISSDRDTETPRPTGTTMIMATSVVMTVPTTSVPLA